MPNEAGGVAIGAPSGGAIHGKAAVEFVPIMLTTLLTAQPTQTTFPAGANNEAKQIPHISFGERTAN